MCACRPSCPLDTRCSSRTDQCKAAEGNAPHSWDTDRAPTNTAAVSRLCDHWVGVHLPRHLVTGAKWQLLRSRQQHSKMKRMTDHSTLCGRHTHHCSLQCAQCATSRGRCLYKDSVLHVPHMPWGLSRAQRSLHCPCCQTGSQSGAHQPYTEADAAVCAHQSRARIFACLSNIQKTRHNNP